MMKVTLGQGLVVLTPGEAVNDYNGPWNTVVMIGIIMLFIVMVGGYVEPVLPRCEGGWTRVPFYNYATASMYYSDYQLRTPGSKQRPGYL